MARKDSAIGDGNALLHVLESFDLDFVSCDVCFELRQCVFVWKKLLLLVTKEGLSVITALRLRLVIEDRRHRSLNHNLFLTKLNYSLAFIHKSFVTALFLRGFSLKLPISSFDPSFLKFSFSIIFLSFLKVLCTKQLLPPGIHDLKLLLSDLIEDPLEFLVSFIVLFELLFLFLAPFSVSDCFLH